ncbi:hypothetical protein C2G38_2264035 [Gigaspora rosea]|uniref:Uncharacterized protein n=1 Tax=Gigaspora rosea TaxID=44941 RepID=A0A397UK24_9GLOM|nr:hypothetical protein C2G38_2264035 [Gigaspora rosea]
MILDDYKEEYLNPRIAIDSFLKCYQSQIELIYNRFQVKIRKFIKECTQTIRDDKTIP